MIGGDDKGDGVLDVGVIGDVGVAGIGVVVGVLGIDVEVGVAGIDVIVGVAGMDVDVAQDTSMPAQRITNKKNDIRFMANLSISILV